MEVIDESQLCLHLETHVARQAALTLVKLNGHATSQQPCISAGAHEHVGLSSQRYLASESNFVGLLLATLDV